MGWMFSSSWETRAEMIAYLRRPERFGPSLKLLKASSAGNNHWYLVENVERGLTFIGLDLMKGGTKERPGWGYKDLDESCGPYEYNCPLSYLKLASPATGHSIKWRESVLTHHGAINKTPLKAGDIVRYGNFDYLLKRSCGPRKGWEAVGVHNEVTYRIKCSQLAKSKVNPTAELAV